MLVLPSVFNQLLETHHPGRGFHIQKTTFIVPLDLEYSKFIIILSATPLFRHPDPTTAYPARPHHQP
jgi:hypothetical protein